MMLLEEELLNHFSAVLQHCGLCHKPPRLAGVWDFAMILGTGNISLVHENILVVQIAWKSRMMLYRV